MDDKQKPCCTNCEHTTDFAGNYVFCLVLRRLVDWYWWKSLAPDDCPLLGRKEGEADG